MVGRIVRIVAAVALVAPITAVDEPGDGGAAFIMIIRLEKDDFFLCVRSAEDQKKGMVAAENFQLVRKIQR